MLLYRLSFYPKLAPVDPDLVAPLERAGMTPLEVSRKLGVEQVLVASHAAGFERRNWTLDFGYLGRKAWLLGRTADVDQATQDMTAMEETARGLLRDAVGRLGTDLPNPTDDGVVGASAPAWAELGRALQAEADGRWPEAARHARAAGPPFAALADFYEAVQGAEETGKLPRPARAAGGGRAPGAGRAGRRPARRRRRGPE